jgi:cytochrome c-type biogenesis protein CcmE
MPRFPTQVLVGGLVIVGALAYLGFAVADSGWTYYTDVDRFVSHPEMASRRVRLHGTVRNAGEPAREGRPLAFELAGARASVRVEFSGPIPERFEPDREVVVEGALDSRGVFRADRLLTKCASKYEARSEPGTEPRP